MNIQIDCPHCHRAILAPEDVEVECPLCRGKLIAERPVLRARPNQKQPEVPKIMGCTLPFIVTMCLLFFGSVAIFSGNIFADHGFLTTILLTAAGAFIYFLPTAIASSRNATSANMIFVLNLLLGITVLGWIAAFIWAAVDKPRMA